MIRTECGILTNPRQAGLRVDALDSHCVILEIACGMFEENDIVRIEDDYQRTTMPNPWVAAA